MVQCMPESTRPTIITTDSTMSMILIHIRQLWFFTSRLVTGSAEKKMNSAMKV